MKNVRKLEESGIIDYDYVNDILFFKVKNREYSHSIELLGYVIDLDTEGFVVGLQIFNASTYFKVSKTSLRQVSNWKLEASLIEGVLQVRLTFRMIMRNRIIEKSPILVQRVDESIPNSSMICTV